MDYSRYLILFSGGADSTYFVEKEPTATHLIFYAGSKIQKTQIAQANATRFGRWLTVDVSPRKIGTDGEINQIHALYDTEMALAASITAASFGMLGIVMCFNKNDIGIDTDSIKKIMQRAAPEFDLALPLINTEAAQIRSELKAKNIPYVSCMIAENCGKCPKCLRGY
ncbi:MAG TPA: hypothetical protein VHX20_00545 [Terracidiphilus sp.]|jgi:7-cyano-7-deazaguanine synthase in queuosine biosynthesis|nr:hypothetical protein [Terracidiphilus sp.]